MSLSLVMALALTSPELKAQDTMIVRFSLRVSDFRFDTQEKEAGFYELCVPVSQLSTVTYFLRLETPKKALTEKLIIRSE